MGVPEADDHWRSLSGGAERDPAHDDQLGHGTVHTLRLEQGTCHRSSGARLMHRTPYTGVMRSQLSLLCKRPVQTLSLQGFVFLPKHFMSKVDEPPPQQV